MADIKYKLDWFSGTKKPSEQAVEDTSRKGIASRPGADTPTQEDYYTKMYRLMSSYFDSDEEASKVLSSKKPNSDAIKSMTMQEYAEAVKESAGFVSKAREMAGITKSLTEGGGEIGRKPLPEGTTLRPVARPPMTTLRDVTDTDEGMLDDEQPLRELSNAVSSKLIKAIEIEAPVKEETDEDVDAAIDELVTDRRSAGKDTEESTPVTVEKETTGGLMSPSSPNLLDFIGKGEGGYDSANRGTIKGNVIGSQRVASRGGKKVSELTVDEIQKYQEIKDPNNKDRLFTVGKYQAIPSTFNRAVKGLGLSGDTVFSPEVQDKVGMYLISEKRPKVGMFLRGEGEVSTDTAVLELAKEFASIPVPFAIPKGKYGKWPKTDLTAGDSFYKDPKASSGNKAQHSLKETRAALERARK